MRGTARAAEAQPGGVRARHGHQHPSARGGRRGRWPAAGPARARSTVGRGPGPSPRLRVPAVEHRVLRPADRRRRIAVRRPEPRRRATIGAAAQLVHRRCASLVAAAGRCCGRTSWSRCPSSRPTTGRGSRCSMKNLFGVMPGAVYGWPKNVLHFRGHRRVDPRHHRDGPPAPGDRRRDRRHGGRRPDHGARRGPPA